jgi:hypothetical protein
MTNHQQTVHRWLFAALALAAGVASGVVLPMGSAARAQALEWAGRASGTGLGAGEKIAVTALGESYVTGRFQGTATFGRGEVNETMLTSEGGDDIFVAKYDRGGALEWARRAGGIGLDRGRGIAVTAWGKS